MFRRDSGVITFASFLISATAPFNMTRNFREFYLIAESDYGGTIYTFRLPRGFLPPILVEEINFALVMSCFSVLNFLLNKGDGFFTKQIYLRYAVFLLSHIYIYYIVVYIYYMQST